MKLPITMFLLAALLFSIIVHIFEQKSIRAQQKTIVLLESTMRDQTAAIDEQNRAMEMCREAIHRADQVMHDQNATLVSCAVNELKLYGNSGNGGGKVGVATLCKVRDGSPRLKGEPPYCK